MLLCTLLHNNYSKFRRIIVITVAMIHMFIVLQWHYGSLATTVNYSWIYFKFSYKRFWWPFHFSASVGIVDSFRWCVCVEAMFSKCNDPKQQCVMLEEITKKSRLVYFRSTIFLCFAYIMYVCARLPLPFIDVRFQQFLQNWKRYYLVHFDPARYFRSSSWSCFNARAFLVVAIYKDNLKFFSRRFKQSESERSKIQQPWRRRDHIFRSYREQQPPIVQRKWLASAVYRVHRFPDPCTQTVARGQKQNMIAGPKLAPLPRQHPSAQCTL